MSKKLKQSSGPFSVVNTLLCLKRHGATASGWLLYYGLVKTREEGIKCVNNEKVRINNIIARPNTGYYKVKKEDIKIIK